MVTFDGRLQLRHFRLGVINVLVFFHRATTGKSSAAMTPMMAMTVSSSMSVKAQEWRVASGEWRVRREARRERTAFTVSSPDTDTRHS